MSPFAQEEGKSTGRVILGLAEGRLSPGHSLWQVLLAVPLTLQELARMSLHLGQCSMLDKVVMLSAKSTSPPLASAPVKERGKSGKF